MIYEIKLDIQEVPGFLSGACRGHLPEKGALALSFEVVKVLQGD